MTSSGGQSDAGLELRQILEYTMEDGTVLGYEVTAILEDTESGQSYAVLQRDLEGDEAEVIVTDLQGRIVEDESVVADVLDNYEVFAEEAGDDEDER